jgi:hypothetical protein
MKVTVGQSVVRVRLQFLRLHQHLAPDREPIQSLTRNPIDLIFHVAQTSPPSS